MPKKRRDDSFDREKLILWVDFSRKAAFFGLTTPIMGCLLRPVPCRRRPSRRLSV
jgi:hypothetical protein